MTQNYSRENVLSFHFIVRFQPLPGMEAVFREELLRVTEPTRQEIGCLRIDVFESLREPFEFAIHSEWADEAAFELHATLPHTMRFLRAARKFLTHSIEGLRLRQIGGGPALGARRDPSPRLSGRGGDFSLMWTCIRSEAAVGVS
jgi:quinol monooxygenase YgiN